MPLHFCVQKHAARHLHYDFRLEHNGVLVSWAVPKGPPTTPAEKHLAIKVEDHPLEYRHFQGIIPEGNYGAGTVELFDEGTYTIKGLTNKAQIEKEVARGLSEGHLVFTLQGNKLNGEYALIKTHMSNKENEWLLIKMKQ